jgi:hypothetical protein
MQLCTTLHATEPLIEIAVALEKVALSDEYFIKRKLYPNVDFYRYVETVFAFHVVAFLIFLSNVFVLLKTTRTNTRQQIT